MCMRHWWVGVCLLVLPFMGGGVPLEARAVSRPSAEEFMPSTVDELHRDLMNAWDQQEWANVLLIGEEMLESFPESPLVQEVSFLIGVAHYQLDEPTAAVEFLDQYLLQPAPRRFVEALEIKLLIAEHWATGGLRRMFNSHKLPKWAPAGEDALKLFDEVLAALPNHPLATRALLGKGMFLQREKEFKDSTEAFQALIKKFPRDLLAQEAFVRLIEGFELQSRTHFHDPNLLDQAELSFAKFEKAFPGTSRIEEARSSIARIRARYADGCVETADFYRRLGQPSAAAVYYATVLRQYPETDARTLARKGLEGLQKKGALPEEFKSLLDTQ